MCWPEIFILPELQRGEPEQGADEGDDPKARDHDRFPPAGKLEVMVQRRHAEDAPALAVFAFRVFEIESLDERAE